jgi:hypothetical protein
MTKDIPLVSSDNWAIKHKEDIVLGEADKKKTMGMPSFAQFRNTFIAEYHTKYVWSQGRPTQRLPSVGGQTVPQDRHDGLD